MEKGSHLGAVQGELENLAGVLRAEHATHEENGFSLRAEGMVEQASRHLRPLLLLLSAAVLCVLPHAYFTPPRNGLAWDGSLS